MRRIWNIMKSNYGTFLLLLLLAAGMGLVCQDAAEHRMQQQIAGKILRFHVRANSDSQADQELKLKVRDAVGSYMQNELKGVADLEDCKAVTEKNLPRIIRIAREVICREGYDYPVTASIGTADFPVKTYGEYSFPAGSYQALNLVIGSGAGKNWWCVMYPNMCFHGGVYEVVEEEAGQSLRRVLSEDEYDAVLKSGKYRIRFKYLDILNRFFDKSR